MPRADTRETPDRYYRCPTCHVAYRVDPFPTMRGAVVCDTVCQKIYPVSLEECVSWDALDHAPG